MEKLIFEGKKGMSTVTISAKGISIVGGKVEINKEEGK